MMEKTKKKRSLISSNQENIIAFLVSTVIAFFFLLKSWQHPWLNVETGTDSSVFKTIAMMMEKGYMPYRDSFDHKGPLLYILNWIGGKISSYGGIWVIELIFLAVTIFMIYKIARLSCRGNSAIVVMLISISLLFGYFEGGNYTEEYAMPFLAIGIFIFIDYLKNKKISMMRLILSGFSCGAVLLLRPNMIAVWVTFCIVIFVIHIWNRNWKELGNMIVGFSMGVLLIVLPILIWLAINQSLLPFWEDYILFNTQYTSEKGSRALFSAKWDAFFSFLNTSVCIVAFFSMLYHCKEKNKILNGTYLAYMIVNLLLICMSGMVYLHYGMIIVPMVSYPLSLIFSDIEDIEINSVSKVISILISIYALSNIILPNWIETVKGLPNTYENRKDCNISDTTMTIAKIVEENTGESEKISVYGNWDFIYVLTNRTHATRYSYQFPIAEVKPEIMEEYISQMEDEQPPIVVIQAGYKDDNISSFLEDNEYELIWSENKETMDEALVYMK